MQFNSNLSSRGFGVLGFWGFGGGGGAKVSRYGRCCFEIWEGLCGGWEDKNFKI